MRYEYDRENDGAGEPSLAEMTRKAINILSKGDDGFFLLVEGQAVFLSCCPDCLCSSVNTIQIVPGSLGNLGSKEELQNQYCFTLTVLVSIIQWS